MTARVEDVAAALRVMGYSAGQAMALAADPANMPRMLVDQRLREAAEAGQPVPLPSMYGLGPDEIRAIVDDRSYGSGQRAMERHGLSRGQVHHLRRTYGASRA